MPKMYCSRCEKWKKGRYFYNSQKAQRKKGWCKVCRREYTRSEYRKKVEARGEIVKIKAPKKEKWEPEVSWKS